MADPYCSEIDTLLSSLKTPNMVSICFDYVDLLSNMTSRLCAGGFTPS